ncbi:hypothetical protein AXK11_05545 [Cephaloticoccus primus]|uniref:SPOR domain-containing protein n=1 Tax=Cephaloticoccus primus TaxID=1548207 RepID=A0A139SMI6_9BACT|nr:hypothetical protein AXK11_05545 [Cephaloticoccus primus]
MEGQEGGHWAIFSGSLNNAAAISGLRECFQKAGLKVHEDRFQAPRGGEAYSVLSAGGFRSKAEAAAALAQLDCSGSLQVQHRAALGGWVYGPWTLDVIVIDPALYKGTLISARRPGVSVVSEIARAHQAPVAINGSFFHGYPPPGTEPTQLASSSGISIIRGEWYNEPDDGAVLFVENTGAGVKAWISQPHGELPLPQLKWLGSGETVTLTGINRMPRKGDELIALRPEIYEHSKRFGSVAADVLVLRLSKSGELSRANEERGAASRSSDAGDLILLGAGKWRAKLEAALAARERMALDLRVPGRPELSAFRGGPILIKNGEPVLADRRDVRYARTAAGIDAAGKIYLITIDSDRYDPPAPPADGSLGSVGAKLSELRNVMQFLGATDAINLDGGGVMVIEGELASRPVDPISGQIRERRYLDVLLLLD